MKKYLAMLCALMMLTVLPSCNDNQKNGSEPSNSVSESATEEIVLDSEWECDYLTIAKSSEWEEQVKTDDNSIKVDWNNSKIRLSLHNVKYREISEEEFIRRYQLSSFQHDVYGVLNTFEKNGQTYIVMGVEESTERELVFWIDPLDVWADDVDVTIYYSTEDEEIVMQMIDSIEFEKDIQTTESPETTTEPQETTTTTVNATTITATTEVTAKATEPVTERPAPPPTEPPTKAIIVVQEESRTVYYTETGSKYHCDSKCGRGTYYPCTLDEALEMGLEPCKKCAGG